MPGPLSASIQTRGVVRIASTCSSTYPSAEVQALLEAVVMLIERYVPPAKQEAEISDLIAVTQQIVIRGPQPLALLPER